MRAAVRHEIRYHTKDHNGLTRAERNALADHPVPEMKVPDEGAKLWRIFWSVSPFRTERGRIPPSEIANWLRLNGKRIATVELPVLEAMDGQFLETLAEEIASNEERRKPAK